MKDEMGFWLDGKVLPESVIAQLRRKGFDIDEDGSIAGNFHESDAPDINELHAMTGIK